MHFKAAVIAVTATAALLSGESTPRGQPAAAPVVREIAVDTLHDLAIAVWHPEQPVIYYNPVQMQRLGPKLAAFFMAHEYGHIAYRHTRAYALGTMQQAPDSVLQRRELEADCYAAQRLAQSDPAAVQAAIRFFSRMGQFRYDTEHPTGAQRAANVIACQPLVPVELPETLSAAPARGSARNETVRIQATPLGGTTPGQDVRVWIDGKPVGVVSNRRQPAELVLPGLSPGRHRYRLSLTVFVLDDLMQFLPGGQVTSEGAFDTRQGQRWRVDFALGSELRLVQQGGR